MIIKIEQSVLDDLKVLHNIDGLKEIKNAIEKDKQNYNLKDIAKIVITNNGDINEG